MIIDCNIEDRSELPHSINESVWKSISVSKRVEMKKIIAV
jgi:hypothetical protein